jgi:predicted RNase H-like nuclease
LHGSIFAPENPRVDASFADVLDTRPSLSVVALNAPVGCADQADGRDRTCDREARILLGASGASLHSAPTNAVVELGVAGTATRLDTRSSWLVRRHLEVLNEMAPYRQRMVFEVDPEMSFYQLNGDAPLRWPAGCAAGRAERRALLAARIAGVERILDASLDGVSPTDLHGAAACLWTARRIAARTATRIPSEPEWDSQGLRMEIVR